MIFSKSASPVYFSQGSHFQEKSKGWNGCTAVCSQEHKQENKQREAIVSETGLGTSFPAVFNPSSRTTASLLLTEAENFHLHPARVKGTLGNICLHLTSGSVISLHCVLNCTDISSITKESGFTAHNGSSEIMTEMLSIYKWLKHIRRTNTFKPNPHQ